MHRIYSGEYDFTHSAFILNFLCARTEYYCVDTRVFFLSAHWIDSGQIVYWIKITDCTFKVFSALLWGCLFAFLFIGHLIIVCSKALCWGKKQLKTPCPLVQFSRAHNSNELVATPTVNWTEPQNCFPAIISSANTALRTSSRLDLSRLCGVS